MALAIIDLRFNHYVSLIYTVILNSWDTVPRIQNSGLELPFFINIVTEISIKKIPYICTKSFKSSYEILQINYQNSIARYSYYN